MPRYKVVSVPERYLCSVRPVLMVGVNGQVLVRGRALFGVFGVRY